MCAAAIDLAIHVLGHHSWPSSAQFSQSTERTGEGEIRND